MPLRPHFLFLKINPPRTWFDNASLLRVAFSFSLENSLSHIKKNILNKRGWLLPLNSIYNDNKNSINAKTALDDVLFEDQNFFPS